MTRTLLIATLTLAGCTAAASPPSAVTGPAGSCRVEGLTSFVGQRASDARAARLKARSGARTLRWIAPNTAVTMDFRPDRLNVYVNDKGRIERFSCA